MDTLANVVGKAVAQHSTTSQQEKGSAAGAARKPASPTPTPSEQKPVPITFTAANAFKAGFFGALGIVSAWGLMFVAVVIVVWLSLLAFQAFVSS